MKKIKRLISNIYLRTFPERYIRRYVSKTLREHHSSVVSHSNRIAEIRKHLEESNPKINDSINDSIKELYNKNLSLTYPFMNKISEKDRYQDFYDYLEKSPINRHDLSEFNKLITENDFTPRFQEDQSITFFIQSYAIEIPFDLRDHQ